MPLIISVLLQVFISAAKKNEIGIILVHSQAYNTQPVTMQLNGNEVIKGTRPSFRWLRETNDILRNKTPFKPPLETTLSLRLKHSVSFGLK